MEACVLQGRHLLISRRTPYPFTRTPLSATCRDPHTPPLHSLDGVLGTAVSSHQCEVTMYHVWMCVCVAEIRQEVSVCTQFVDKVPQETPHPWWRKHNNRHGPHIIQICGTITLNINWLSQKATYYYYDYIFQVLGACLGLRTVHYIQQSCQPNPFNTHASKCQFASICQSPNQIPRLIRQFVPSVYENNILVFQCCICRLSDTQNCQKGLCAVIHRHLVSDC